MSSNIADLLSKYQLDDKTIGGVELSETGKDLSQMVSNYKKQLTAVSGAYESDSSEDEQSIKADDEVREAPAVDEEKAKSVMTDISGKFSSKSTSIIEPEAESNADNAETQSDSNLPIYSKLIEKIHKYHTTGKIDKLKQIKEKLEPKKGESEQIKKVVELIDSMLKTSGGSKYKKVMIYRDTISEYNKLLKDGDNLTAIKALLKKILHAISIQRVDNEQQFMNLASTIELYIQAKSDEKRRSKSKGGKEPKTKATFKLNDFLQ
ncbi:Uncharacterised protein [uncultured archaeon]|nr:Uncharacterised protein [uncultured archaeon]